MIVKCKCGKNDFIMVEYSYAHPERYDGISELKCKHCNRRYGRWTGKELKEGEYEKRL